LERRVREAGGGGTIFRLTRTGALTTLYAFESATGVFPYDGLAEGPHGTFFGTASQGANSPGNGTIISGTAAGGFSVLYYFLSMQDGHCPFTGVVRDAAGNLFGTTVGFGFGGQPQGSVFEYTAQGQLNTLYSFTDGEDGEWPQITPTLDASGNVWGVSAVQNAGPYAGAVWSIESSGFSIRYAFSGSGDGWQPNGPLLLTRNGVFYGTTVGRQGSGLLRLRHGLQHYVERRIYDRPRFPRAARRCVSDGRARAGHRRQNVRRNAIRHDLRDHTLTQNRREALI
jgi:hypothetical protein